MRRPVLWILLGTGAVALLVGLVALVWKFLEPADRSTPVAWDTLKTDVASGNVIEITIQDDAYSYREAGKPSAVKRAKGPPPTFAVLATLAPSATDRWPPKIRFEGDETARLLPVAFSDFMAEVHSGRVSKVRIKKRLYVFSRTDSKAENETRGPEASRAEIEAALRPSDAAASPPTLTFE